MLAQDNSSSLLELVLKKLKADQLKKELLTPFHIFANKPACN
jgi:hypothetical protein